MTEDPEKDDLGELLDDYKLKAKLDANFEENFDFGCRDKLDVIHSAIAVAVEKLREHDFRATIDDEKGESQRIAFTMSYAPKNGATATSTIQFACNNPFIVISTFGTPLKLDTERLRPFEIDREKISPILDSFIRNTIAEWKARLQVKG